MKTKKIILLVFVAILATSCGKEIGRCDFTEEQKQLIPYKKGQVINFTDHAGKIVDVIVTKSTLDWQRKEEDSGGMIDDYFTCRRKIVKLKSEPDDIRITLTFEADGCINGNYNYNIYNTLEINVEFLTKGISNTFSFPFDAEGNAITNGLYYSNLEINGNVYYDVIEEKWGERSMFFYNKTYGILQVNSKDGENLLTINP